MSNIWQNIQNHFSLNIERYVLSLLIVTSLLSCLYFLNGNQHINYYGDSIARMNISRRVIDNLTPGLAQLGGIWLPVPQLLMLPFVANNFLWRSGLAGMFMSATFYVIGGFYLFKSIKSLNISNFSAILALLAYMLNINMLYTQTTAMSEPIFIAICSILTYALLKWSQESKTGYLILSAVSISLLTLIRYEGLAVLFSSILLVGLISLVKNKKYSKMESEIILFSTLAGFGFLLWTIYLAFIFGDPLYWKNLYVDISPNAVAVARPGFIESAWKYFTSVVWMNGVIPVAFSLVGLIIVLFSSIKDKSVRYLPLLLQLSIFAFMIMTLMRNTPISQPALTIDSLFTISTNQVSEFNIRYGMLMLPVITVLIGVVISKHILIKLLFIVLFSLQLLNTFYPYYTSIYQITYNIKKDNPNSTDAGRRFNMSNWMRDNYDEGLILVSAARHDPQMFKMNIPYKMFIHEGTAKYWTESLDNPTKYATWIIMDYTNWEEVKDRVTNKLKDSQIVEENYDLVYDKEGLHIYKIKTQTDVPYQTIIN